MQTFASANRVYVGERKRKGVHWAMAKQEVRPFDFLSHCARHWRRVNSESRRAGLRQFVRFSLASLVFPLFLALRPWFALFTLFYEILLLCHFLLY